MCGRLPAVKGFSHACSVGWRQLCVRPFHAAHMAAGHNAFRGSGPGQKLAFGNAVARVGCPNHRISRCITCCLPSTAVLSSQQRRILVRHRRRMLSRKRHGFLITLTLGHHRPSHSGELIGKLNGRDLCRPPVEQRCQPRPVLSAVLQRVFDDGQGTGTEKGPEIAVACLGDIAKPFAAAA